MEGKTFLCEKKNKIGKIQNPPGNAYTLKDVSLLFYPKRTALIVEFKLVVVPGVKNCLPVQGTWVQSLVRELGPNMLRGNY